MFAQDDPLDLAGHIETDPHRDLAVGGGIGRQQAGGGETVGLRFAGDEDQVDQQGHGEDQQHRQHAFQRTVRLAFGRPRLRLLLQDLLERNLQRFGQQLRIVAPDGRVAVVLPA